MIVSLAGTVEGEIGGAMSNAISGVISGTQTAQEAFSQMFQNIGKAFIDMATQMIAKALIMKALGILAGGAGGSGGGIGSVFGSSGLGLFGAGGSNTAGLAFSGLMPSFAGGGPTGDGARAGGVDGQGGFPAILHPQETVVDHFSASEAALADGRARSDAFTETEQARINSAIVTQERLIERERFAAMTSGYEPIDVRVEAVDPAGAGLVTVQQLEKSSRMAVQQAQAQMLAKLRNNPSTRSTAGIR
jgi:hypothetical protein